MTRATPLTSAPSLSHPYTEATRCALRVERVLGAEGLGWQRLAVCGVCVMDVVAAVSNQRWACRRAGLLVAAAGSVRRLPPCVQPCAVRSKSALFAHNPEYPSLPPSRWCRSNPSVPRAPINRTAVCGRPLHQGPLPARV
jgi:hypothetical protein